MAPVPPIGAAITMPLAYEEASQAYLTTIRSWASLAAFNRPRTTYGGASVLGAFQRYPRAFVFAGGPR